MARTREGAALTLSHWRQQLALRAGALADLVTLWAVVDATNLADTIGPFTTAAALLVRARNHDSASLAVRYYRAFRFAEGIAGEDTPRLAERPPRDVVEGVLRGAALASIIRARKAGSSPQAATGQGLVAVSGSASSLVLDGGRDTITASVASDRRALGWQRITSADPCYFCRMIAGRGPVFKEETADFQPHDHCACAGEPYYEGSQPPARNLEFQALWQETTAGKSGKDAINAFRRAVEGRE